MSAIHLELPFPPSVNGIWRGGKGGRHFLSPKYKAWKQAAGLLARAQSKASIKGPFCVSLTAVRPDKRRRDIDNIIKPAVDLLVACGFVEDDSLMHRVSATWTVFGPPLYIYIEEA